MLLHVSPLNNNNDNAAQMIDNALATYMHGMKCTVNQTMRTSTGALTFHRNILINIPLAANLESIRQRKQQLINENIRQINQQRINYDDKLEVK